MRPHGKYARVDPTNPSAFAICDLCGLNFNLRDTRFNFEWAGQHLYNTGSLRCWRCVDVPQEQLRTIILPPDPEPVLNARVPNYAYENFTVMIAQFGARVDQPTPFAQPPWQAGPQIILCDQTGEVPLILQYRTSS
jgi:hypothetical protein